MNSISTKDDAWLDECENWARQKESFQVQDFQNSLDDIFADFLCAKYKYVWQHKERTALFTPLASRDVAGKPVPPKMRPENSNGEV